MVTVTPTAAAEAVVTSAASSAAKVTKRSSVIDLMRAAASSASAASTATGIVDDGAGSDVKHSGDEAVAGGDSATVRPEAVVAADSDSEYEAGGPPPIFSAALELEVRTLLRERQISLNHSSIKLPASMPGQRWSQDENRLYQYVAREVPAKSKQQNVWIQKRYDVVARMLKLLYGEKVDLHQRTLDQIVERKRAGVRDRKRKRKA